MLVWKSVLIVLILLYLMGTCMSTMGASTAAKKQRGSISEESVYEVGNEDVAV